MCNHLKWGLRRDTSVWIDRFREGSTIGSQCAGDRWKFFYPFRSKIRNYLLQAHKKLVALVSLFEVASRAHLYKDLVIYSQRDQSASFCLPMEKLRKETSSGSLRAPTEESSLHAPGNAICRKCCSSHVGSVHDPPPASVWHRGRLGSILLLYVREL